MSATASSSAPAEERFDVSRGHLLSFAFLGSAILAFAAALLIMFSSDGGKEHFAFCYLFAYMVGFTICAGSLFWVLLHHAVDADWSVVVRRMLEHVACLFPVLVLLGIPLCFFPNTLFEWWGLHPGDTPLYGAHKAMFLNQGWFTARLVAYFVILIGLGWTLRHLSVKQDRTGDPKLSLTMRKLSYGGIILFVLTITFVGVDWMMSLNYEWFSTMWGVYTFAGSAVSSMALLIIITNILRIKGYFREVMTVEHNHIMGKLLFAFTVFWAYIAFSQYMLIYYANLPEETIFYMHRNVGTWNLYSKCLVTFHFFIPFLWLLTQPTKWNYKRLLFAAFWIIGAHIMDLFWVIIPQYQIAAYGEPVGLEWKSIFLGLLCLIWILGMLGFFVVRSLGQSALFPHRDPRLYDSVTLMN